ncbi:MAG: hypothetical protein ACRES9_01460 [Gammaproteobacteria bacterium]
MVESSPTTYSDVWTGYSLNSVADAAPGMRIASIRDRTATTVAVGAGGPELYLDASCTVKYGRSKMHFAGGSRVVDFKTILDPGPVYLILMDRTGFGRVREYVGVHPDGTIGKLYFEPANLFGAYTGKVTPSSDPPELLGPGNCKFRVTHAVEDQTKNYTHFGPILGSVTYMGRNSTGILEFAYLIGEKGAMSTGTVLVPASAGTYQVDGLSISILGISGYNITYEILGPAPLSPASAPL